MLRRVNTLPQKSVNAPEECTEILSKLHYLHAVFSWVFQNEANIYDNNVERALTLFADSIAGLSDAVGSRPLEAQRRFDFCMRQLPLLWCYLRDCDSFLPFELGGQEGEFSRELLRSLK